MAKRKRPTYGSLPGVHHKRAANALRSARYLAKVSARNARRGECETALEALVHSAHMGGQVIADRVGEGRRKEGTWTGVQHSTRSLIRKVGACFAKKKIIAGLKGRK